MRNLFRIAAVLLLAGSAAACLPVLPPFGGSMPTPTPSPTPLSTLDAFKFAVASSDFQAQGSVSGTVKANLIIGSASGTVSGSFKIKGGDDDVSISLKILGQTVTYDNIVTGGSSYSRSNGGGWSTAQAPNQTLQSFISGAVLSDAGIETKFGRELHHITVADPASVDPAAFGIGAGQGHVAISALSFWAESDGSPAGVTLEATMDQKIVGTDAHETVALEIAIDRLWGVTIEAPTS